MKRLSIALLFVGMCLVANAQVRTPNAMGLRLGWGVEFSYQRQMATNQRIEADLGLFKHGLNVSSTYQWVIDLSALAKGFNWYVGPGITLGTWESNFAFGVAGQIGLEYNIPQSPIQLSIDYRPTIFLTPDSHFDAESVGLGVRYQF